MSQPKEYDERCWPLIREHHDWFNEVVGSTSCSPCLFGDLRQLYPVNCFCDSDDFLTKYFRMRSTPISSMHWCYAHRKFCSVFNGTEFETAGLPCQPNSGMNTCNNTSADMRFEQDPRFFTYIAWAFLNIIRGTLCLVLENVRDGSLEQ